MTSRVQLLHIRKKKNIIQKVATLNSEIKPWHGSTHWWNLCQGVEMNCGITTLYTILHLNLISYKVCIVLYSTHSLRIPLHPPRTILTQNCAFNAFISNLNITREQRWWIQAFASLTESTEKVREKSNAEGWP
jgi:hypothetical protein